VRVDPDEVQTNIVIFEVENAFALLSVLWDGGSR
jgi:hypothetical protein